MPRRTDRISTHQITELSSSQTAAIDTYKTKWHSILINNQTKPIEHTIATESIESIYQAANFNKPQIFFFDNPFLAIKELIDTQNFKAVLGKGIDTKLIKRTYEHNNNLVNRQLTNVVFNQLVNYIIFAEYPRLLPNNCTLYFPSNVSLYISQHLEKDFYKLGCDYIDRSYFIQNILRPLDLINNVCRLDFCIDYLKLQHDKKKWKVLQDLVLHGGLMFAFEKVCMLCDRSTKMVFSNNQFMNIDNKIEIIYPGEYKISSNI